MSNPSEPATSCHRCTECAGQEHHFLAMPEWNDEAGDYLCPCKHCDVRAPICYECGEGYWPVVDDGGRCAECKFDSEDD